MIATSKVLKQIEIIRNFAEKQGLIDMVGHMEAYRKMFEQDHLNQKGKAHLLDILELAYKIGGIENKPKP